MTREQLNILEETKSKVFRLGKNNLSYQLNQWNLENSHKFDSKKRPVVCCPPVLFYGEEQRGDAYYWRALYSNHLGEIYHDHGDTLDVFDKAKIGGNNEPRAVVLDTFCKIDFVLDVMIMHGLGFYIGTRHPNDYKKFFLNYEGKFHKTSLKIKELGLDSNRELRLCRDIRNEFAHMYNRTSSVISREDVEKYGSGTWSDALLNIFNQAWATVLERYVPIQDEIIKEMELV